MEIRSDFLYAKPSFLEGVARLVDFGGTLNEYNFSQTGDEADARATWMDWAVVGQDMRRVMERFMESSKVA